MSTTLLTLRVRSQRDVLAVRQRARQLAGLLGFDKREQLALSAAVFEVAARAFERGRKGICFQVEGGALRVMAADLLQLQDERAVSRQSLAGFTETTGRRRLVSSGARRLLDRVLREPRLQEELRLEKPLPTGSSLTEADLAWAVRELQRQTPLDLFEEIRRQNREMLEVLVDLTAAPPSSEEQESSFAA